ncbi:MAG: response regulator [Ignavibacteriales bacterium]
MNILIVDDSKFMRTILRSMLSDMGFLDIYEATNGWEAIRKTYIVNPELIFMNLVMPEMDGFEASKQILECFNDAKIIIVTSDKYSEIEKRMEGIKMYDFISLPIEEEKLRTIMIECEEGLEQVQL